MKYYKQIKPDGERTEVPYEEALKSVLSTFRDNDMSRDMLTIPNNINCRYAWVYVVDDSHSPGMVMIAGLWNVLPDGVEYDENGNRI